MEKDIRRIHQTDDERNSSRAQSTVSGPDCMHHDRGNQNHTENQEQDMKKLRCGNDDLRELHSPHKQRHGGDQDEQPVMLREYITEKQILDFSETHIRHGIILRKKLHNFICIRFLFGFSAENPQELRRKCLTVRIKRAVLFRDQRRIAVFCRKLHFLSPFGECLAAEHFQIAFQCMHKNLIVFQIILRQIILHLFRPLSVFRSKLPQQRAIEILVVRAVPKTFRRIQAACPQLMQHRDRLHCLSRRLRFRFLLCFRQICHKRFPQHLPQDAFQIDQLDRLADEAVKACRKEGFPRRADRIGRQRNNRDLSIILVGTDALQRLNAVHAGHHMIHKHNVKAAFTAKLNCLRAGACGRNLHAIALKNILCNGQIHRFVVHDQCADTREADPFIQRVQIVLRIEDRSDREAVERLGHDPRAGAFRQPEVIVCHHNRDDFLRDRLNQLRCRFIFLLRDKQMCQLHGGQQLFQIGNIVHAVHLHAEAPDDIVNHHVVVFAHIRICVLVQMQKRTETELFRFRNRHAARGLYDLLRQADCHRGALPRLAADPDKAAE